MSYLHTQLLQAVKLMRDLQNIKNPHKLMERELKNVEGRVDRLIKEIEESKTINENY